MNTPTSAGQDSAAPRYDGDPPFSADEFWNRVLELLRYQEGFITKERFEEVMGVSLIKADEDDVAVNYKLDKGIDWYAGVSLLITNEKFMRQPPEINGVQSAYTLRLSDPSKKIYDYADFGWCIPLETAIDDVVSLGWELAYQKNTSPLYAFLSRDNKKSNVTLGFSAKNRRLCVFRIAVVATP